jgi:hypothetical protein
MESTGRAGLVQPDRGASVKYDGRLESHF